MKPSVNFTPEEDEERVVRKGGLYDPKVDNDVPAPFDLPSSEASKAISLAVEDLSSLRGDSSQKQVVIQTTRVHKERIKVTPPKSHGPASSQVCSSFVVVLYLFVCLGARF